MEKGRYMLSRLKRLSFWTLCFFASLFVLSSCDYERTQYIPKEIEVISEKQICKVNVYTIKAFELQGIDLVSTAEWQKGLVCEGYSDRPMNQPWVEYSQLPDNTKNSLAWFFDKLSKCNIKLRPTESGVCIAACRTESINEVSMKTNWIYHVVFILDKNKQTLYEIRSLD